MDPLLTVPPLTPTLPSSSVINLVSCSKQSNGHAPTVFKDELIKKENVTIRVDDLKDLLEFFAKTTYKARDTQPKVIKNFQFCQAVSCARVLFSYY